MAKYIQKIRDIAHEVTNSEALKMHAYFEHKIQEQAGELTKQLEELRGEVREKVVSKVQELNERVEIVDLEGLELLRRHDAKLEQLELRIRDFVAQHKIQTKKDFYDVHSEILEAMNRCKMNKKSVEGVMEDYENLKMAVKKYLNSEEFNKILEPEEDEEKVFDLLSLFKFENSTNVTASNYKNR